MKEYLAQLQNSDPAIREAAATPEVLGALIQRLREDEDKWVLEATAEALRRLLRAHPEGLQNLLRTF